MGNIVNLPTKHGTEDSYSRALDQVWGLAFRDVAKLRRFRENICRECYGSPVMGDFEDGGSGPEWVFRSEFVKFKAALDELVDGAQAEALALFKRTTG